MKMDELLRLVRSNGSLPKEVTIAIDDVEIEQESGMRCFGFEAKCKEIEKWSSRHSYTMKVVSEDFSRSIRLNKERA